MKKLCVISEKQHDYISDKHIFGKKLENSKQPMMQDLSDLFSFVFFFLFYFSQIIFETKGKFENYKTIVRRISSLEPILNAYFLRLKPMRKSYSTLAFPNEPDESGIKN